MGNNINNNIQNNAEQNNERINLNHIGNKINIIPTNVINEDKN